MMINNIQEIKDNYIYVVLEGAVFDARSMVKISSYGFRIACNAGLKMTGKNGKDIRDYEEHLTRAKIMTIVDELKFDPYKPRTFEEDGKIYLNKFINYPEIKSETLKKVTTEHINKWMDIVTSGHESGEAKHLIWYLAHCYREKGKKIHHAIVLQGTTGSGKSIIGTLMNSIMGSNNVHIIAQSSFKNESFNAWVAMGLLGIIEELDKTGSINSRNVTNRFKGIITQDTIEVTYKGKDPMSVTNYKNYIICTNDRDSLYIDKEDRRTCFILSKCKSKEDLDEKVGYDVDSYYRNKFMPYFISNPAQFKAYLDNVDLFTFSRLERAPMFYDYKEIVLEDQKDHVQSAIEDFTVGNQDILCNERIIISDHLRRILEKREGMNINDKEFYTALKKLGYNATKGVRNIGNNEYKRIFHKHKTQYNLKQELKEIRKKRMAGVKENPALKDTQKMEYSPCV